MPSTPEHAEGDHEDVEGILVSQLVRDEEVYLLGKHAARNE